MTDFKALRDEMKSLLEGSLTVRLDVVIGGRDARTLIGQQKSLDVLALFVRNSDAILAALDLADKASGYREALVPFAREAKLISKAADLGNKSWGGTGLAYCDWWNAEQALQGDDNGQG